MKRINEAFTNAEFSKIKRAKDLAGKNWHDWILGLVEISRRENAK